MASDLRDEELQRTPIEDWIGELANAQRLPRMAIDACLARPAEAAPLLRQLLIEAAESGIPDDADRREQLFCALHLLGGMRDTQAFQPLLKLLQAPAEALDDFLGDMTTETLPQIVIAAFDDNVDALFQAIERSETEDSIRGSLIGAAAFLTWEGRIDRERMTRFLERLGARPEGPGGGLMAYGWSLAISLLGLRTLAPLVYRAVEEGSLDQFLFLAEDFEETLGRAEAAPEDPARFEESALFPIENVADELASFAWGQPPDDRLSRYFDTDHDFSTGQDWSAPIGGPIVNPLRGVGRNDPCPCGSGKKAKRCCLVV